MAQPLTMNPELVYQLVASNPNLKNIVEQTAQLMQIQQQMGPTLQQMAANPMAAVNGFFNWAGQQHAAQQPAQQTPQEQPVQPQTTQQGGQPMGMMEQALGIVEEFRKSFEVLNNNLVKIHDMCAANAEAIKALSGKADEAPAESKSTAKK